MMHPDQRALLNGIIAEPERDDLRLVYADWLEEREESVECGRCKGTGLIGDQPGFGQSPCFACGGHIEERSKKWTRGTGRVSNGLKDIAARIRWQCDRPREHLHTDYPGQRSVTAIYNRGFIAEARCTMAQWLQHGPSICSEHPVERVVITDKEPDDSPSGWTYYGIDGGGFDSMHVPVCIQKEPRPDMYFPSVESANADLSARCIEWAREQAKKGHR